ncbi:MAG: hypothetical protein ABJE95_23635 [Byssovorax sp.]
MTYRHCLSALTAILTFAPLVAGCGGTPETNSTAGSTTGAGGAPSTTSTSTTTTGSSGGAGGASSSSGSTSSTGTGGPPGGRKIGSITLVSGPASAAMLHMTTVKAGFLDAPDGKEAVSIASPQGACEVRTFLAPAVVGTPVNADAGVITITGGKVPITMTPDAMSKYADVKDSVNDLFDGGEAITIAATGGMVPGFATKITASAGIDLTLPLQPANNGPLSVDRKLDLVFTWKNGAAGEVVAVLDDGMTTRLTCTFQAAAGTGTIPKTALAKLAPTASGLFVIGAFTAKTLTGQGWTITLGVGTAKTWNGVYNPQTFSYKATN